MHSSLTLKKTNTSQKTTATAMKTTAKRNSVRGSVMSGTKTRNIDDKKAMTMMMTGVCHKKSAHVTVHYGGITTSLV